MVKEGKGKLRQRRLERAAKVIAKKKAEKANEGGEAAKSPSVTSPLRGPLGAGTAPAAGGSGAPASVGPGGISPTPLEIPPHVQSRDQGDDGLDCSRPWTGVGSPGQKRKQRKKDSMTA